MTFKEIAVATLEYRQELALREEVLRRPLGLPLSAQDLAGEENQIHFGLFGQDGELVACVVAVKQSPTEVRIRQMAVSPPEQGRGLGQRLVAELERNLQTRGFQAFVLNARKSAVGFYERLGYKAVGDEFVHLTVPHIRMTKVVR